MADTPSDARVDYLLRMRSEAKERRRRKDPRGAFLAIFGLNTQDETFRISAKSNGQLAHELTLEPLEAAPTVVGSELTRGLAPRHQLCLLGPDVNMHESWVLDGVFWTSSALLRLASDGFFVMCELADRSWDIIDGVENPALTHVPMPGRWPPGWWPPANTMLSPEAWAWVVRSIEPALEMRVNRTFHFAFEAFWGSFDESDPRMAASKVWAGIESIFGIQSELRFRLALYAASVLEPSGEARVSLYRRLLKLYDQRSKVVHGGAIEADVLTRHVVASQDVLRRLLRDALEVKHIRTPREIEELLLGASEAPSERRT
ncbi:hypothetical protein ACN27F_28915 [Solwaraspora sp. WMMB335]|uniref:hypothetical protein n=1 Tax=Solwaraspora sp. WMMB335 TaxID=3404118 RepID=UPI003B94AEFF